MLDAFYRQLFRADETPPSSAVATLIAGLVVLVMTLNAGSRLQLPTSALSPFLVLFLLGGALGLFWFAAALFALTSLWGGTSHFFTLLRSILVGLWPLIFSGVALSIQSVSLALGALFSLTVAIGVLFTLSRSLAVAQSINQWLALISILVVVALSGLAILGLFLWPLMILVGL
jgi:hypothetical protein